MLLRPEKKHEKPRELRPELPYCATCQAAAQEATLAARLDYGGGVKLPVELVQGEEEAMSVQAPALGAGRGVLHAGLLFFAIRTRRWSVAVGCGVIFYEVQGKGLPLGWQRGSNGVPVGYDGFGACCSGGAGRTFRVQGWIVWGEWGTTWTFQELDWSGESKVPLNDSKIWIGSGEVGYHLKISRVGLVRGK